MEETNKGRKHKKILLIAGGALVLILVALVILAKSLNPWAQRKLTELVATKSKGLYTLQLGSLNLSLLAGSATLDSVKLIPHDSVWANLQKQTPEDAPASISELKVSRVQLRGIPYVKLLFGGDLSVSSLVMEYPDLELRSMKKDTSTQPLHVTVGQQFRGFKLSEVHIEEGKFRWHQKPKSKRAAFSLTGVELKAKNFQLDSIAFQDSSRAFYAKEIIFTAKASSFFTPEGNYQVKGGAVKANSKDKSISLVNLHLVPLRSAAQMSKLAGEAATRFQVQVPSVSLQNVDFHNFSKNSNVYVASVQIQNPKVSAYKNSKLLPAKSEGPLPHDVVRKLPFGLNIRKVEVENLYVRYEELAEKALRTGFVTGSNIDLTLTNFTNDKNLMTRKTPAVLKASGLIMGKAPMQATVRLPLLDPSGYHTLEGTIGKGYPVILNSMIEPSMFVSVESGVVERGSFKVYLTRSSAKGTMRIQYDDFKVDLLSKEKEKKQSFGKKLKSLIADKLVLKSDSEDNGKSPREGNIMVNRRPTRSFLTYWKDCLANGVLSIIGAPM